NHHLAVGFRVLQGDGCDILQGLSGRQRRSLRRMVTHMVLATDMSKHAGILAELRNVVREKRGPGAGELRL
ncbi:PDE4A phosphodiesterase, partial [Crypturellus undulatus]|nr:PDE4A phosphodiesterase [Crypturellus undulatus]